MTVSASHSAIVSYWANHSDECGLGVDWAEAHERCWRCAYRSALERCHIVPRAMGGPDDVSNLILLCGRCHREAPNVSDPRFMWIWLRATCVPVYGFYWMARGMEEFEVMFGRAPFKGPAFQAIDEQAAIEDFRSRIEQCTIHFGEGMMNPSTYASIYALMEEELTGNLPEPVASSTVSYRMFRALGMTRDPTDGHAVE